MGRKNVLEPYKVVTNQSLSASFQTNPTDIMFLDNVSIQINVITTDSSGTFGVQASSDKTNWGDLTLSGTPTIAGASDVILIDLDDLPYRYLRTVYTSTSAGTGTCTIYITAKAEGS